MRKRLLCLVLLVMLAALVCPSALASAYFQMEATVYTGLRGGDVSAIFDRIHSGPAGWLLAMDEQGAILGQSAVASEEQMGSLTFRVPADAPAGQTLRFVFRHDGIDELQQECLLAADSAQHIGVLQGDPREKKIAVTFDAAYGEGRLDALLEVLGRHHARCTFFLQGDFVVAHPDLTARIDQLGHEIANHTMHHPNDIRELNDDRTYYEIVRCNEAIEQVTGKAVTLYRPPSGYSSYRDRAISRALGCEVILWTFDSMDGFLETSTRETVWNTLIQKSEPGAIILMHIYGYYTPEILDEYLPMMKEKGYAFVTVTELLNGSASVQP